MKLKWYKLLAVNQKIVGSSPIRHPNILAYPLCLIHSRKGNRLHVGSTPSASTTLEYQSG